MAAFNRLDYGTHITYQIVDDANTIANLTPDEAQALLDWLYEQREQVYQDVHAHDEPQHQHTDSEERPKVLGDR